MKRVQIDLVGLTDAELSELITGARAEQQRRALADGDLDAALDDGFDHGFARGGKAEDPWLVGEMIICPGSLSGPSRHSHECSFVKVGEQWVWQAEEKLADEVRPMSDGGRYQQRSVTVLASTEGLELDRVTCKFRTGAHRLTGTRSFKVNSGVLELVSTRTVKVDGHLR